MQKATQLAVKEVNDANVGIKITAYYEDDKTTDSTAAPNTFSTLVAKGVAGIEGPCCSGVTGAILDLAVQNKVVVASPSATSPKLTLERNNSGFFWRIASSDAVQGKVLSDLVRADSITTVRVVAVNNPYGTGLAGVFKTWFTSHGGTVDKTIYHDEGATTFSSQVTEACAAPKPQAIVLVVYTDEGANILKEMVAQGCRSAVKIYASEGVYDPAGALATKAGKDSAGDWIAAGVKGTTPQAGNLTDWTTRYHVDYPGEEPQTYSAEAYDAVMYLALAAFEANSANGKDLPAVFHKIANPPGTACRGFKACADLIVAGQDIDYKGYAHDFKFDANYEPDAGIYSWWEIKTDGTMSIIATDKQPAA